MNLTVHLRIHFPNNQEQEKLHHQKISFTGGAESSFPMLLMSESQMPVTVLNLKDIYLMNQQFKEQLSLKGNIYGESHKLVSSNHRF